MSYNLFKTLVDFLSGIWYNDIEVIKVRKPPSIAPRMCVACGAEFTPTGTVQKYCTTCKEATSIQRKREWYARNHPGAYAEREQHFCVACGQPAECRLNGGEWYCNLHWQRMNHHGTTERQPRKSRNTFIKNGNTVMIRMKHNLTAIVDASDVDMVKQHSWCVDPRGYVVSNISGNAYPLHRYLLNPPTGLHVDHINGNRLDNRRSNLRICTGKENARNKGMGKNNKTGHVGVELLQSGKYLAKIMVDRKSIHLGRFDNIEDAVSARLEAEAKYFGEFAPSFSRL